MGRLVRLELSNFKSYKGHQIVGPFSNFTCIIGPNGAGKSNLMDAISFVLGVRSAHLRSTALKDLIYRGGAVAEIDPNAELSNGDGAGEDDAPQTAWVLAVYQDSAGREWKFMRTISLQGTSEYKLNGRTLTFAKYNEVLEKENILVKAKNFLVFQGDVETIAGQTSKDLTKLFEQISGSLDLKADYDRLKLEAERAQENATHTFNKKRSANSEARMFKEQKGEVARYDATLETKDKETVHHLLWKLFQLEKLIKKDSATLQERQEALQTLREAVGDHHAQMKAATQAKAKTQMDLLAHERKVKALSREMETKRPALAGLDEKIDYSERKTKNVSNQVSVFLNDIDRKMADLEKYRKDQVTISKESEKFEAEAKAAAQKKGINLTDVQMAEYSALSDEARLMLPGERARLQSLVTSNKTSNDQKDGIKAKLQTHNDKRHRLLQEQTTFNDEKQLLESKSVSLSDDVQNTRRKLDQRQEERVRIKKRENEVNEKLQEIMTKLLEASIVRGETQREAKMKDALRSLQRNLPGMYGRVIDLCKPTEQKYQVATGIVLGRYNDAIIVDKQSTAVECMQFLRRQEAGSATFLPLESIRVKSINERLRTVASGARLAIDVLSYDQAHEKAFHFICGNSMVCDTYDIVRHICYEKAVEVKAVSLDGTVIHKGGKITGGASITTNTAASSGDEVQIEGLTKIRDNLLSELDNLQKAKLKDYGNDQLVQDLSGYSTKLESVREDLKRVNAKLAGLVIELSHADRRIAELKKQSSELGKVIADAEETIAALSKKIESVDDEVFADLCRRIKVKNIREYERSQKKVDAVTFETRAKFSTQLKRLQALIAFGESQLSETETRLSRLRAAEEKERAGLQGLSEERQVIEDEMEKLRETVKGEEKKLKKLKESLEAKSQEVDEHRRAVRNAEKEFDKAEKEILDLNDDIEKNALTRLSIYRRCRIEEIQVPRKKGSFDNVPIDETAVREARDDMDVDGDAGDRVFGPLHDFGLRIDFSSLTEAEKADGSSTLEESFKEKINSLQAELDKLVPNSKANGRLEDAEGRLQNADKQYEQARREARRLKDQFDEIAEQRRELFTKAFEHVSKKIQSVYHALTKSRSFPVGGKAYLTVEDGENPFESTVRFTVQPPMKPFRDMDQLSGGEKTMAALALLLSIQSFRPSPFFVLDEVDAALDNANVGKIASYLRNHAKMQSASTGMDGGEVASSGSLEQDIQFIVISLKGSLYEKSDALVGVYRDQDENSSKILTLDLSKYEEE